MPDHTHEPYYTGYGYACKICSATMLNTKETRNAVNKQLYGDNAVEEEEEKEDDEDEEEDDDTTRDMKDDTRKGEKQGRNTCERCGKNSGQWAVCHNCIDKETTNFNMEHGIEFPNETIRDLTTSADELERRVAMLEANPDTNARIPSSTDFLFEYNHEKGHIGGVVVDEEIARISPCHKFKLDKGDLIFSKGIVGALDDGQQALYCPEVVDVELTPENKQRYETFRDAAITCQGEVQELEKGDRLQPWLKCMTREAGAKGEEL